jgi:hypothetical protein
VQLRSDEKRHKTNEEQLMKSNKRVGMVRFLAKKTGDTAYTHDIYCESLFVIFPGIDRQFV